MKVIFGTHNSEELSKMKDLGKTEIFIFLILGFLILFFGFYPEPIFQTINASVNNLIQK